MNFENNFKSVNLAADRIKAMTACYMSSTDNDTIEKYMYEGMQHYVNGPAMTYSEHDIAGSTSRRLDFYYAFDRLMTKSQFEVITQNDIKNAKGKVSRRWYTKNGLLHNPRGAAVIRFIPIMGMVKEYWINGVQLPCDNDDDFKLLSFVDTDKYFNGVDRDEKIYEYKFPTGNYAKLAKVVYNNFDAKKRVTYISDLSCY
jgi:hypothetical protein